MPGGSSSPLLLIMTLCPGLLYITRNLAERATASCRQVAALAAAKQRSRALWQFSAGP